MVKRFNHLRPSAETRQRMQYNDYHYWVLAEIIAKLSGMTVIDYAQKHILDPLNMTSTTWNHTEAAETGHIPRGYQREGRDLKHCREIHRQKGRFDISCHGRSTEIEWFIEGDGLFHAGPAGMTASFRDMVCTGTSAPGDGHHAADDAKARMAARATIAADPTPRPGRHHAPISDPCLRPSHPL